MSDKGGDNAGSAKNKKLRYAWIIASVVALAIILSPVSPFSIQQPLNNNSTSGDNDLPEPPQPEDISDEDIAFCSSVNDGVQYIVAGGPVMAQEQEQAFEEGNFNTTQITLDPEQRIASNVLTGELCNRPELVREIASSYDAAIVLVAYGCDAASAKIGDAALQVSLEEYQALYCESAIQTIRIQADSLIETVDFFRTNFILPDSEEESESSSEMAQILDEIIESAMMAKEKVDSGAVYEGAILLDQASAKFGAVIEQQQ